MPLLLRIMFAWLLIAAVPMQGVVVASLLFCGIGSSHQHTAEAGESHDHAAMHSRSGDAAQSHAYAEAVPPADASPDTGHKCSICAACCNGVALVGLDHMVTMAPAPKAELAEPFVLIHTLSTPVPDKPPRA